MKRAIFAFTAGMMMLWLSQAIRAQSFTATLSGSVRDSSGAVIPGATVTAVNEGTNFKTAVTTSADGGFIATSLPPGAYRLEVTAPGFKKYVREEITLRVQQNLQLEIALTVGDLAETVVVEAQASSLETTGATLGKVVDNQRIVNLPLNTRNVYSLIFLTPGVTGTIGNNYGDMRYSVNGARARTMDTLIDGVTAGHATVNGFSGISVFPSVDAVEEYKVMSANLSAEFGRSLGNVLNVVFKSGTNQFHGSLYEFLRNSVLDSNNFFDNARGQKLASFKRSQFGYFLSGPIRRDKTFFMVSFEALRARTFANRVFTVPTAAERRGDFSQTFNLSGGQPALIRIFDPFSTRRAPTGTGFVRDPFPGNAIPASMFDPVANNVVKFYPSANTPGAAVTNQNNYSQSGSGGANITQHDYRIDQVISPRQRFFARYSTRLNEQVPLKSFPDDLTIAEGRIVEEDHVHGAVADYTNTISPNSIFTARLGFARTLYIFNNQGLGYRPSALGLPPEHDTAPDFLMFPRFAASGQVNLGGGDHRRNAFMSYSLLNSLTRIQGRHQWKIGWEGRLIRTNTNEARSAGDFNFTAAMTQGPNPQAASPTAGYGLASLLLGAGSGGSLIQNFKNVATQSFYWAGYIQDDWRVTPRLTVNLGLRWDMDTPRTERFDRTNYFEPNAASPLASAVPGLTGGLIFVGRNGQPRTQFPYDRNNFGPRIGIAYQINAKTVFRAGYSHMFGASLAASAGTIGTQGFRRDHAWVTSLDGVTPLNLLRRPYPDGFPPAPGAAAGLLTQVGSTVEAVTRDMVTPWTRQINANIQRELPGQAVLEVAYVGTRGFHLFRNTEGGLNINQLPPSLLPLGSALNELVDNPFFGRGGTGLIGNSRIARGQLLRPYPQFGNIVPIYSSGASSFYNSMQVTLSKRYSRGLVLEGAYTWAKNIDDQESHQDSYNIRGDRALASIDLAHSLVLSYVYELPLGRGRKFGSNWSKPLDLILGQWQFNGISTFQTGTPLAVSASNSAGLFNPLTRPDNNGTSAKLSGPVHQRLNRYLNMDVFTQPAPFRFGNVTGRLPDVRNDGVRNFDLSLFKDFRFTERLRLQFRGEFLNAFNTPRFGGPNTSVTSSARGVITSQANAPRQIQFGLKLLW